MNTIKQEMKLKYLKTKLIFILFLLPFLFYGQTITHPSSGSSSTTVTCGTTYTYFDPGGGGNYSNNQLGTLVLNPSTAGQYVSINFGAGAFDVETHASCNYDWIMIYDGPTTGSPLIGKYCNSNVPGTITSSSGSLTVVFDSDGGVVGTGWAASVSCTSTQGSPIPIVHPSSGTSSTYIGCGATYTYYDPGGTGNYSNNQLGTYTIYPNTAGQMVQINFGAGAFDVETHASCNYDWIMIYDGPTTGSPLIGKYCNSNIPGTITSTTGPLTIVFDSDGGVVGSGWVANVLCFSPCATVAGTSSSSVTTSCGTVSTTLSLAGEGAGTIQWQQSTDGGVNWSNIPGATTDPFVYSTNTTALFRAAVTNGCTSYSSTSSITFSCPDIIHPSSGTSSTTIQCGGSYTYRDPGNTNNYGNDQNGLITICPSAPGQYVNVNFTSFNTEGSFDYFYVFDGYDAHAPLLGVYDGNGALSGNVKATSSNSSGCLSFRFYSDGATVRSGWEGTVTCSGTPSAIVPTTNPEDCQGAIVVCGDENLFGGVNSSGYNELPDPWNYCIAGGENQSTWYAFSPATSGTIAFEIIPDSPTDYDWAVWGPYASLECPAFNNDPTLRCSSSQLYGNGNTGLLAAETDTIEQNGEYAGCCGADGDGFLKPINAQAGEIYVLMLDNWDVNSVGFELHWNLTNGATLDCSPVLPVNLVSFTSLCDGNNTILSWVTETETNNDYFALEKSDENFEFYEIGRISGKGNSNITNTYTFTDKLINENTSYYRLKQVDFDGKEHYHRIIASNCFKNSFDVSNLHLTDNKLDMIISSSSNEEVMIYLYSSTGKLIAQQKITINSGNNKFSLNDLNVNSGIYFVAVVGKQNKFSGKIIKE